MKKKLHDLYIYALTFLFGLTFVIVPIAVILGCVKLITLMFG